MSLQSFGKLINGEKRSTIQVELSPPVCSDERRLSIAGQSQPFSNRQQPLIVVNNSGSGRPRRNSLDGKELVGSKMTASPNGHAGRTCKTPPDQQSMKVGKPDVITFKKR